MHKTNTFPSAAFFRLCRRVSHPSTGITKEYSVTLDRKPSMDDLGRIAAGAQVRTHSPAQRAWGQDH